MFGAKWDKAKERIQEPDLLNSEEIGEKHAGCGGENKQKGYRRNALRWEPCPASTARSYIYYHIYIFCQD